MPNPDEEPEPEQTTRRRPSHIRSKRTEVGAETRTVLPRHPGQPDETARVVRRMPTRHEDWSHVINHAPALPDPLLERPVPPPAPLPSKGVSYDSSVPRWLDDRHRRRRVEDIIGTVGLAILVAAMLAAMWLQMRQP